MGQNNTPTGERRAFVFRYDEHEWMGDVKGAEPFAQRMLLQADVQTWAAVPVSTPNAIEQHTDPEITSLDDLRARVEESLIEEADLPPEVVRLPFKKLHSMMKRSGWRFVSGTFLEFEGNHNDTEIHVVLEKK